MQDPRQKMFSGFVDQLKDKLETLGHQDVEVNDRDNVMFASNVNLGRLQDTILELMEKGELSGEKDIAEFVVSSVQRPKQIKVEPWEDSFNKCTRYSVFLVTKDDYGYYEYKFYTRLTKEQKGD